MSIRIASGIFRGMTVETPRGEATRPTASRVRAAIMNVLQTRLPDGLVLDLCAGSGAVGIEMVSRGARGAVFVESSRAAVGCLRRNLDEAARRAAKQDEAVEVLDVVADAVERAVTRMAAAQQRAAGKRTAGASGNREGGSARRFAVAWLDPPYAEAVAMVGVLAEPLSCLADLWVVESDARDDIAAAAAQCGWSPLRVRDYGRTRVSVLTQGTEEAGHGEEE